VAWVALLLSVAALITSCSESRDAAPVGPGGDLSGISESQQAVLEDGVVTPAEYEAAGLGFIACLRESGITVVDVEFGRNGMSFVTRDPLRSEQREFDRSFEACRLEHFSAIELAWAEQNAPTEAEQVAFYRAVADCLLNEGITADPTDPSSLSAAHERDPVVYEQCFHEAIAETQDSWGGP
jgi:hypothetical protein